MNINRALALCAAFTFSQVSYAADVREVTVAQADVWIEAPLDLAIETSSTLLNDSPPRALGSSTTLPAMPRSMKMGIMASNQSHQINCTVAYNLNQGAVYSDSITTIGEQHCYVMPLAQQSKVVAQLQSTDSNSNFSLYLYAYDAQQGLLSLADSGDSISALLQQSVAVLSSPSYILVAQLNSGSGGNINFLGNSYSNYDQHEPNDSPMASKVPSIDIGTKVIANLDNPSDVDYYAYSLASDQSTLRLTPSGSAEHQVQLLTGNGWAILPMDATSNINASEGATLYVRAVAAPDSAPSDLNNYQILSSYKATKFKEIDLWTRDQNVINRAAYNMLNVRNHLGISGYVTDDLGNPVSHAQVKVKLPIVRVLSEATLISDQQGKFSINLELEDCYSPTANQNGDFWSNYGTPATQWRIWWDEYYRDVFFTLSGNYDEHSIGFSYAQVCNTRYLGSR